jgi:proline iminopeptidase
MDQRHMGFLTREFVTVVFSVPPFAGEGGLGCVQAKGTRRRCRASLSVPIAAQMDPSSEPLYAQVEPYDSGFLKVSDVHTIYYEQSGNPQGHVRV